MGSTPLGTLERQIGTNALGNKRSGAPSNVAAVWAIARTSSALLELRDFRATLLNTFLQSRDHPYCSKEARATLANGFKPEFRLILRAGAAFAKPDLISIDLNSGITPAFALANGGFRIKINLARACKVNKEG